MLTSLMQVEHAAYQDWPKTFSYLRQVNSGRQTRHPALGGTTLGTGIAKLE